MDIVEDRAETRILTSLLYKMYKSIKGKSAQTMAPASTETLS